MAKNSAYYLEENVVLSETVSVPGAIAANRFINRSGAYPATNGAYAAGVTQQPVGAAGGNVAIATMGVYPVEVGAGPIALDTPLIADTAGKVRPASNLTIAAGATPVASTAANGSNIFAGGVLPQRVVGWALDAATGSGTEFIRVHLAR